MNNSQQLIPTGGQGLNQTSNPQSIGSQNLAASPANLQNSNNSLIPGQVLKIFKTNGPKVLPVATVANAPDSARDSSFSPAPYFVLGAVVMLAFICLIIFAIKKGQREPQS